MSRGRVERPFRSPTIAGPAHRAADLDRAAHPPVAVPDPPGLDPAAACRTDRAISPVRTSIIGTTSIVGAPVLDAHDRSRAPVMALDHRSIAVTVARIIGLRLGRLSRQSPEA